ncbi:hypothetical protein BUALT_Bualt07G0050700 [Buddleja alternifolia]|uniref:Uncharacterized protein n=1 Tax=Buddleja alternifolia TaxID=168488 RepID=A0AAV6XEU8_9LAMI|nr:hypothetical protein BUALT_Bualt07G0050700 [Buddleja alternifolia]
MEDEKLAAYYDELTRKGGGAARFKQGLGFSSAASDAVPSRGSALPAASSSSFLSSFVRASSPSKTSEFEKQAQLQSIQNKLSLKPKETTRNRSPNRSSSRRSRSRSPSRDINRDKHGRRRSRSRDRYSRRNRSRSRERRSRRRSRSRSREDEPRRKYRSRSRSRENDRERSRREKIRERSRRHGSSEKVRSGGGIDFANSIQGYDNMTPAERVKAKMKLQLSETAENDGAIGKGSGWERFDFNKDAPLDDEEEIEAAEDDATLVKNMGQSFRFSAVEARKEERIKATHDEAIFGGSSYPPPAETDDEEETHIEEKSESAPLVFINYLSVQVLTMKQGSWRDRARKA